MSKQDSIYDEKDGQYMLPHLFNSILNGMFETV